MIITFAGHSFINSFNAVKDVVKDQIRNLIASAEFVTFYIGGYGTFDEIAACACRELKKEYSSIEVIYVTPYIRLSEQKKIKEMQSCGLCDASIYPPIENVPQKFAISKRNEWMVENSDILITYVVHHYGGAYKTLKIAERQKKKIINIFDIIQQKLIE